MICQYHDGSTARIKIYKSERYLCFKFSYFTRIKLKLFFRLLAICRFYLLLKVFLLGRSSIRRVTFWSSEPFFNFLEKILRLYLHFSIMKIFDRHLCLKISVFYSYQVISLLFAVREFVLNVEKSFSLPP